MNDLIDSLVEVRLKHDDNFLKVKETLTRIGVAAARDQVLYQSCHILHKQGRYYIVHFKELFALDGKPASLTSDDIGRRNTIAALLDEWGLVEIIRPDQVIDRVPLSLIKILPYKEKDAWTLIAKYTIGKKR